MRMRKHARGKSVSAGEANVTVLENTFGFWKQRDTGTSADT